MDRFIVIGCILARDDVIAAFSELMHDDAMIDDYPYVRMIVPRS